jgi:hypothetical protein
VGSMYAIQVHFNLFIKLLHLLRKLLGEGDEIEKNSWWPLVTTWDEASCGENYGRWTYKSEMEYEKRLGEIEGGGQPSNSREWYTRLRGQSGARNLKKSYLEFSKEFLINKRVFSLFVFLYQRFFFSIRCFSWYIHSIILIYDNLMSDFDAYKLTITTGFIDSRLIILCYVMKE